MWRNYEKFQEVLRRFRQNNLDHRADMQLLIPRTAEGAYQLMLMYTASCLNFADSKRCMEPKSKFKPVLMPGWAPDKEWHTRILEMGITENGEYSGNDPELLLLDKDIGHIRKPRKGMKGFLPLFKTWQKEVFSLGDSIYPSGELTSIMEQMCQRAMRTGQFHLSGSLDIRPKREGQEFRVKVETPKHDDHIDVLAAAMPEACRTGRVVQVPLSEEDKAATANLRDNFDYADKFYVRNDRARVMEGTEVFTQSGETCFRHEGRRMSVLMALAHLNEHLSNRNRQVRAALDERLESQKLWAAEKKMQFHADAASSGTAKLKQMESTNMTKTTQFVNTVKGIFGDVIRMQRGRAAVHAAKRIIFKAFPIKWGILARITGKAKLVEDHPLTDVAVALLAHGAASALLEDPAKRQKYLKYTEEMVAASVAHAGFKMVPVEEILDKVLNGALDSEAVQKVKNMLADKAE